MRTPVDLLAHHVLSSATSSNEERLLASEVLRLRLTNQRLEHRNAQLEVQHAFAFEQWRTAVQRGGRLSGELQDVRVELARATTDRAAAAAAQPAAAPAPRTTTDELDDLIARIEPPTVVAPYTEALEVRAEVAALTDPVRAPHTVVVRRPPPLPPEAYRMPKTLAFKPPARRRKSTG